MMGRPDIWEFHEGRQSGKSVVRSGPGFARYGAHGARSGIGCPLLGQTPREGTYDRYSIAFAS
jgi:hypothetical protein